MSTDPLLQELTDERVGKFVNGYVVGIFGNGGCGQEVLPLALDPSTYVDHLESEIDPEVRFVVKQAGQESLHGIQNMTEEAFFAFSGDRRFVIAINNSSIREEIAEKCHTSGIRSISLRATNSTIHNSVETGEGAIICGYSTVGPNVRLGKFVHANVYSYIAHDCLIGDFVTLGPRVCCNGNIHVRNHAYIGAGALLRQGSPGKPLVIGEGAVIGMGAVVLNDVPPFTTVVGNPARPLRPAS